MAITFNPIITQGVVYWHTGLWECSYIFLVCLHVNCVTCLEIFPAGPPTDNCWFFLRTVKKILITAISENSSFLAKSLPAIQAFSGVYIVGKFNQLGKATWLKIFMESGCDTTGALEQWLILNETSAQQLASYTCFVCVWRLQPKWHWD